MTPEAPCPEAPCPGCGGTSRAPWPLSGPCGVCVEVEVPFRGPTRRLRLRVRGRQGCPACSGRLTLGGRCEDCDRRWSAGERWAEARIRASGDCWSVYSAFPNGGFRRIAGGSPCPGPRNRAVSAKDEARRRRSARREARRLDVRGVLRRAL